MKKALIYILFFVSTIVNAQKIDLKKSILTIPDSLTINANVVIRNHETIINIKSHKKMIVTQKKLITVLNKSGNNHPFFIEYIDKYTSIEDIKISIYNSLGKLIKKVKNKDILIGAVDDGFSLYNDDKAVYYKYLPLDYPYTIEISYKENTSNTAFLPSWFATGSFFQSIQNKSLIINYPEDLKLNYKEYNFGNYQITKNSSKNTIQYRVSNIKAIKQEALSPSYTNIAPHISFALNKFSLAGIEGNGDSWESFGKWEYNHLLKGRNDLSEETKNIIKNLVKNEEDPIKRAKLVYKYMQDKTRYISVQVGIGGWKPMKASEVDKLGYGDCKALVNYTQSLLSAADVFSVYSSVYLGNKKNIDKDLVSVQGNHIILMLPTKKDTIWLECTSQRLPFGQTSATDDRDVLLTTPSGGKIRHTKKYDNDHNYKKTTGNFIIDENGKFNAEIEIKNTGKQYNASFDIAFEKKENQILAYKKMFSNIVNINITAIEFIDNKDKIVFTEKLKLNAENYAEKIGKDILLRLNAFNVYSKLPKRTINRKYPLEIKRSFKNEDEITINIPTNYNFSKLPETILIENKFGIYQLKFNKVNNNQLIYKRLLQINEAIYPKEDYTIYRNFIKEIIKYDKLKIILEKS